MLDVREVLRPLYTFPYTDNLILRCTALVIEALSLIQPPHPMPQPRLALDSEDLAPLAPNWPSLAFLTLNVCALKTLQSEATLAQLPLAEP